MRGFASLLTDPLDDPIDDDETALRTPRVAEGRRRRNRLDSGVEGRIARVEVIDFLSALEFRGNEIPVHRAQNALAQERVVVDGRNVLAGIQVVARLPVARDELASE